MFTKFRTPGKSSRRTGFALAGIVVLVVIIASMLIGIFSNPKSETSPEAYSMTATPAYNNNPARQSGSYPAAAATTAAAATIAAGSAVSDQSAPAAVKSLGGSANSVPLPADRLIIHDATISLTSPDVDKTLLDLRALAIEKNGVVFASNTSVREDKVYASVTLQVPSAAFDETLNRVHKLAGVRVENENSTSQDVTEEYVDLQAQLTNLKATETDLRRLLDKATTVNEILTVQRELTTVRGQIDQHQGRINYLDKRTTMSSLTFSIAPIGVPVAKVEPTKWDAGTVLENAWAGSLRGLQGLYKLIVTFGVWAIWLLPLGALLAFLLVFTFRRIIPRRPGTPSANPPTGGAII